MKWNLCPSSSLWRDTVRGNKIASSRYAAPCRATPRAVSVRQKRQWMNERVSFEIKRKSPLAPPFSSLHQSQLYPLSPLLSFIITARDFIPTLEAVGRSTRCSAREKEEEGGNVGAASETENTQSTFGTEITVKLPVSGMGKNLEKKKVSNPPAVILKLVADTEAQNRRRF